MVRNPAASSHYAGGRIVQGFNDMVGVRSNRLGVGIRRLESDEPTSLTTQQSFPRVNIRSVRQQQSHGTKLFAFRTSKPNLFPYLVR